MCDITDGVGLLFLLAYLFDMPVTADCYLGDTIMMQHTNEITDNVLLCQDTQPHSSMMQILSVDGFSWYFPTLWVVHCYLPNENVVVQKQGLMLLGNGFYS